MMSLFVLDNIERIANQKAEHPAEKMKKKIIIR